MILPICIQLMHQPYVSYQRFPFSTPVPISIAYNLWIQKIRSLVAIIVNLNPWRTSVAGHFPMLCQDTRRSHNYVYSVHLKDLRHKIKFLVTNLLMDFKLVSKSKRTSCVPLKREWHGFFIIFPTCFHWLKWEQNNNAWFAI